MATAMSEIHAGLRETGFAESLAALGAQERRLLDEYEVAIWEHPERVASIERTLARVQREIERGWGA